MRLNTLGRLELLPSDAPGATAVAVQPKRLALLAYLTLATPRGVQRRDVLLGLFWPDLDQEEARRALRQALHHLRHFLKDGVLVSRADEVVGVADGTLWCDAVALEEAFAAGRATQALELYRGDFLEGFFISEVSAEFEQWVDRTRTVLRQRAAQAAQSLAEQEEKAGNALAAIQAARRAVELAPDDEPAVRYLIGLHHRLKDHAGALRTYDEFARRLAEEFGAMPSADTAALIEKVRASLVPAGPTRSAVPLPEDQAFDRTAGEVDEAGSQGLTRPAPVRLNFRSLRQGALLVVAAGLLAVAIGRIIRPSPPATSPNTTVIAVLPFRTSGAAPELAWLHEGMVDLLTIKLSGQEGLRAVDPRTVMSAWQRVTGSARRQLVPDAAIAVARRIGAGRAINGAVVGTPRHLTLTASLFNSVAGRLVADASVEGPMDSLPALVDQLAGRLLGLEAGTEVARLSSISSRSLPAMRAYLAGRAAFRKGHLDQALRRFREATFLDSTFALAALELVNVSVWFTGRGGEDPERGARLAFAGREQLGPADRALLDNWAGPLPTGPELFQRWQAAASAYPDRAETWYGLADAYFHYGILFGLHDHLPLAAEAFKRGWANDSATGADSLVPERSPIWAEPLVHMVEMAQANGEPVAVRRLVAQGLAADSTSREGWYLRWHRAVALGDSARRAFWADSQRIDPRVFALIFAFISSTGIAAPDYARSAHLYTRASYPEAAALLRGVVALNGGRPHEALLTLSGLDDTSRPAFRSRIHEALYWGGDTSGAAEAARQLAPYAAGTATRGEPARRQLESLCVLATWRAARGDYRYARAAIRRLRGTRVSGVLPHDSPIAVTQYTELCATLLEATRATALRLPEARGKLEQADAAARTFIYMPSLATLAANLVVARVAEAQGDLPLALRAVRRRAGGYGLTPTLRGGWYLSTFLREEGRLAALTGDTVGAVRAYRHYLALRTNPEPAMAPEVWSVRGQLERLVPQAGRTNP